MRKFLLLAAGASLVVGVLAACAPTKSPAPVDPHDVLVVGDSVSFSLGCVLGDGGGTGGCPARPGYTTVNEYSGGCTISPGTLELYNGGQAGAPNCDTVPDQTGRTWAQAAAQFIPKVVVINTAGWEIVDRWIQCPPYCNAPPDNAWGGSTSGSQYSAAAQYYSSQLLNTINMFRNFGAKVLVAVSPYIQPLQPEPPPGSVPAGLECSWWEPYPPTPPTAQGDPNNPLTCPGAWRSPDGASSYRSSHTKLDQFNDVVNIVKNAYFPNDPNVRIFNFAKHFNPPTFPTGPPVYGDYVCPPPNDSTVAPDPVTHQCTITNPSPAVVPAILARAVDHSHLSSAGQFQILQPYLEPCVLGMAGFGGGDLSKCN